MADAFSLTNKDARISIEEDSETGHVSISIVDEAGSKTVEVDADDLARALFTASRTFTRRVAEFVHRALVNTLG